MVFQQEVIGIDIGSAYVKLLQLRRTANGYAVKNYATQAIPLAVRDNAQEKRKAVTGFIKGFMEASHIKSCAAKLALYGRGVYVFFLSVPNMNKKDLRSAIGIELKKRLPPQSDINAMSFDYFVNSSIQEQAATTLQVTCIAIERGLLDEQITFLKELNIRPVSIQAIPDSLGNLLAYCIGSDSDKTTALFDLGAAMSLLNFYKGRNLVFSREIPIGGEHITAALAKGLSNATGATGITADDAEKIKRSCGIPTAEEAKNEYMTDFGVLRGEQLLAMVRPVIERLVMETARTFNYYSKTFKPGVIDQLYLTGGSSRLRNINKILKENIEGLKKVEQLPILSVIKVWSGKGVLRQEMMLEQAAPHLAAAFGMCLGSGGRVNVLPLKERIEQRVGLFTAMVQVFFPLLCLIALLLYASTYANGKKYKALSAKLEGELKQMEDSSATVKKYIALKSELERKQKLLADAAGRQPLWWGIIKELSIITPEDVILRMVNAPLNVEPREIRIFGRISSKHTIVDIALSSYVQALEDSPFFTNVRIASSQKDQLAAVPSADFVIVCGLEY